MRDPRTRSRIRPRKYEPIVGRAQAVKESTKQCEMVKISGVAVLHNSDPGYFVTPTGAGDALGSWRAMVLDFRGPEINPPTQSEQGPAGP